MLQKVFELSICFNLLNNGFLRQAFSPPIFLVRKPRFRKLKFLEIAWVIQVDKSVFTPGSGGSEECYPVGTNEQDTADRSLWPRTWRGGLGGLGRGLGAGHIRETTRYTSTEATVTAWKFLTATPHGWLRLSL